MRSGRTQQQDEIGKQAERFAENGIAYEAWSANTLRLQLAPYSDIVLRHTQSEYWVTNICGRAAHAAPEPIGTQSGLTLTLGLLSATGRALIFGLFAEILQHSSKKSGNVTERENGVRHASVSGHFDKTSAGASSKYPFRPASSGCSPPTQSTSMVMPPQHVNSPMQRTP